MIGLSLGTSAFARGLYVGDPIPLDRIIARLGETEYDGLELSGLPPHASLERYSLPGPRRRLARQIRDHKLAVSGYAPDFGGISPLVESNRSVYLDLFRRMLDFCQDLDCPSICVDTVAAHASVPQWEYLAAFDRLAAVWGEAAQIASERRVRVVWEFAPELMFNRPGEVVALHRKVNHANFQVLFNTCNAYACGVTCARLPGGVPEFLKKLEGRVGGVHLIDSDGTQRPFGDGVIDFSILAPQLLDIADIRWWCVDLSFCPGAWDLIESSGNFVLDLMNAKFAA